MANNQQAGNILMRLRCHVKRIEEAFQGDDFDMRLVMGDLLADIKGTESEQAYDEPDIPGRLGYEDIKIDELLHMVEEAHTTLMKGTKV